MKTITLHKKNLNVKSFNLNNRLLMMLLVLLAFSNMDAQTYEQDFEKGGQFEKPPGSGGFYYDEGNMKMSAGNSTSITISKEQKKTGNYALKCELDRSKDQFKRAEITLTKNGTMHFHKDYWISFDYYRADWDYDSTQDIAPMQIHNNRPAYPDKATREKCRAFGKNYTRNAPFVIISAKDKLTIYTLGGNRLWAGDMLHKQWVNLKIHFRASKESDGIIEVWRNGKKLGATVRGMNVPKMDKCNNEYGEESAPFLKLGVYHSAWWETSSKSTESDSRLLYIDNISILEGGSTLGTDEFQNAIDVTISPNPTAEEINIQFPETIKVKAVSIYNILGKEVFVKKVESSKSNILLKPNLSDGMYILKITSEKGAISKKIIIK